MTIEWGQYLTGVITSGFLLGILQLVVGRRKRRSDDKTDAVNRYEKLVERLEGDNANLRTRADAAEAKIASQQHEIDSLKEQLNQLRSQLSKLARDAPNDSPLKSLTRIIGL